MLVSAFKAVPEAFVIYDLKGRPLRWNRAYRELVAYTDDEIAGMMAWDFHTAEQLEMVAAAFEAVISTGVPGYVEVEVKRKDGTRVPCGLSGSLVRNLAGEPIGVCGVGRDLTDIMRAEQLYNTVIRHAMDGFTVNDLGGLLLDINDAYCQMLGYTREEALGINIMDVETLMTQEEVAEHIARIMSDGHDRFETIHRGKDGRLVDIEASITYQDIEGGRLYSFIRDITRRKRAEAELTRHQEHLEELVCERTVELEALNEKLRVEITERELAEKELIRLNEELEAYAQTVSHELRTPLSGVYLVLEYLERLAGQMKGVAITAEVAAILEKAKATVSRAEERVDRLLKLAKAGQVPDDVSELEVSSVVTAALHDVDEELTWRGATVMVDDDLGRIRANPTHMQQVFGNLLSNAVKHCDSSTPHISISFQGEDGDGGKTYLVRDDGSGIPDEATGELFSPFSSGPDGRAGFGLAIVNKIVKIYGGSIRAYNDDGACFELVLHDYPR